jgi:hypothetical protein
MSKFKVGDVVTLRKDSKYYKHNDLYAHICDKGSGTILEIYDDYTTHIYGIKWNSMPEGEHGYTDCSLREVDIEIKYKYTRLAEKVYPKGYKDGKWWVLC